MSQTLTPYDTGDRLEPHPWVRGEVASPGGLPWRVEVGDFGRVDFDDDEGRTVLTLYVERSVTGGYALHVENLTAELRIDVAQPHVPDGRPKDGGRAPTRPLQHH